MIFFVMPGNFVAFISTVALCGKLCSWNIMFYLGFPNWWNGAPGKLLNGALWKTIEQWVK